MRYSELSSGVAYSLRGMSARSQLLKALLIDLQRSSLDGAVCQRVLHAVHDALSAAGHADSKLMRSQQPSGSVSRFADRDDRSQAVE